MSEISGTLARVVRRVRRIARCVAGDESGAAAAVEFAIILPVLVALSFAVLDFTLLIMDYHRAGEATRQGARLAAIIAPVADLSGLTADQSEVTCTSQSGGVSCGGAGVADASSFTTIVQAVKTMLPDAEAQNVRVTYTFSGIGDPGTPGGILPFATVELIDFDRPFMMLGALPGMPDGITLPAHSTTRLASGIGSTVGG